MPELFSSLREGPFWPHWGGPRSDQSITAVSMQGPRTEFCPTADVYSLAVANRVRTSLFLPTDAAGLGWPERHAVCHTEPGQE